MPDDAEERTKDFVPKLGSKGEVIRKRSSGQRGTRPPPEDKSEVVRARKQAGEAAAQREIKEASRGDGEGLPSEWGVNIRGGRKEESFVTKTPGYKVHMTRTGEPTQEPTLSGIALKDAQRKAERERAERHFGRGLRRYGK